MSSGFFSFDGKLWNAINSAIDAILLNILWLITCIPIFTIGAATTAFYYTTHKVIRNQRSSVFKEYWASLKGNFKQATVAWLIFLVILGVFYLDILICEDSLEAGEKVGMMLYLFRTLTAMVLVWGVYVFAYIARFEDNIKMTLKNAAIMAVGNIPYTLIVLVIAGLAGLICWIVVPFIWFVPALAMVLINLALEKVFRKYMDEEDLKEEQMNDEMRR